MKPFFVYMLECSDRSLYVGHTDELETRLAQHESGVLGGYTSTRRPVRLVWCEEMVSRAEALACELQLKGWSRAKKRALIEGDWALLKRLARGPDRVYAPAKQRSSFDSGPASGGPYAQGERGNGSALAMQGTVVAAAGDGWPAPLAGCGVATAPPWPGGARASGRSIHGSVRPERSGRGAPAESKGEPSGTKDSSDA